MADRCPRCDYEIPEHRRHWEECPKCGVIFDKYDPDRQRMRPMAAVAEVPAPTRPPTALIVVLLILLLTVLFLLRPRSHDVSEVESTPADDSRSTADQAPDSTAEPHVGLSAADLLASPDLDTYGDGSALSQTLTPTQVADARAALDAEAEELRFTVSPVDPSADEEPPAGIQTTTIEDVGDLQWVGWYEDADGYDRAVEQAQRMNRPLIVYFRADWCGWCARFNDDFLPDPLVRRFLSNVIRVQINPEHGERELELSRRYGIKGYPSFLVIPPAGGVEGAVRVHPFRDGGTISTADFVAECEAAAGRS